MHHHVHCRGVVMQGKFCYFWTIEGVQAELLSPLLTLGPSHGPNIVGPPDIAPPNDSEQPTGMTRVNHWQPIQVARRHALDGEGHWVIRGDGDDTRRRNIAGRALINCPRFH